MPWYSRCAHEKCIKNVIILRQVYDIQLTESAIINREQIHYEYMSNTLRAH